MSFLKYSEDCDFPIQNLPYGIFSPLKNGVAQAPRAGVAIGDYVLDLSALHSHGLLAHEKFDFACFGDDTLNEFMELGHEAWDWIRSKITTLLSKDCPVIRDNEKLRSEVLVERTSVKMHLPAQIRDYSDFYSSREHATNVGTMFRGKENALQPNWLHLPVGYHGRASSVVVSGTPIRRPCGQLQKDKANPKAGSVFGECKNLDFELEMGVFIAKGNSLGNPINIKDAEDYIFGFVLLNDWSARDIQKWEYVPLGPFGAKNFGTTISPWVVPTAALDQFKTETSAGEQDNPVPLEYLREVDYTSYDITLQVSLQAKDIPKPVVLTTSNYKNMYWTHRQQLVQQTVTGCNMQSGDLLGSGTISGSTQNSFGSLLELTWNGKNPVQIAPGVERKFLQDGDVVNISGFCQGDGYRIGFGECSGEVLASHKHSSL